MGRVTGAGQDDAFETRLVRSATGFIEDSDRHFDVDGGIVVWGHEVSGGRCTSRKTIPDSIARGTTAIEWLRSV